MASIGAVLHTSQMPGTAPNARQAAWLALQYGLFIHFGINTPNDMEWSDGSLPVGSYAPDWTSGPPPRGPRQWVQVARACGFRYLIFTSKHHDGFTMWTSSDTLYGTRSETGDSSNVVKMLQIAVAEDEAAHPGNGIKLCLYYSLWDRKRNADVNNTSLDAAYNATMMTHLTELLTGYGPIYSLWFDGATLKEGPRWPINEIYALMRRTQPTCVMGVNHTIGNGNEASPMATYPPGDIRIFNQNTGDELKWMSDFRNDDGALPKNGASADPKLFIRKGTTYYLPFEGTFSVLTNGNWFWHADSSANFQSDATLVNQFQICVGQGGNIVFDVGPAPDGNIDAPHVAKLNSLAAALRALSLIP